MSAFTTGTLNQMSMQSSLGKQLSLASAAWYLSLYQDSHAWDIPTRDAFESAISQHSAAFFDNLGQPQTFTEKKDPRYEQIKALPTKKERTKIFTDYEVLDELLGTMALPDGLVQVSAEEEADFLFVYRHIRSFLQLPLHQRVCQYPYEASVVRKDLLPLTVRKHCYKADGSAPVWWQPCYDLSTEFHLFAHDYKQRLQHNRLANKIHERKNNRWIIKPAQGTRGMGHKLLLSQDEEGLRQAACYAPRILEHQLPVPLSSAQKHDFDESTSDRIVQLLVEHPLLIDDRKFDIRCYVFVRSFEPFIAFVPILHYARLANKPYSIDKLDDQEIALTVSAYHEDEAIANAQERRFHTELDDCFVAQYGEGVIDTNGMWSSTLQLLRELFGTGAAKEIGTWPNSSAYYGVDIIFDAAQLTLSSIDGVQGFIPQPKLLEVNFLGDWHGVEVAVGDKKELYHEWVRDLLQVLVLTNHCSVEDLEANPRLHRL